MNFHYMIKSMCLVNKNKVKIENEQLNNNNDKDPAKNKKKEHLKIDYDLIILPLIAELQSLRSGFVTNWSNQTKLRVFLFIADSPCRASVIKLKNHAAKDPCFRCFVVHYKKDIFPLLKSTELNLRTLEDVLGDSISCDRGVKGVSLLLDVNEPNFNYIRNSVCEFMHCAELGFTKNFLKRLLKDSKSPYYLNPIQKELVNERIRSLKLPKLFTRGCRTLDFISDFKALEFKTILFYTCKFLSYHFLYFLNTSIS